MKTSSPQGDASSIKTKKFILPLSNDIIKKSIKEVFGKVIRITEQRHKDGLQSGIRLISMSKNDVEMNPLPSYIYINGYELYVT